MTLKNGVGVGFTYPKKLLRHCFIKGDGGCLVKLESFHRPHQLLKGCHFRELSFSTTIFYLRYIIRPFLASSEIIKCTSRYHRFNKCVILQSGHPQLWQFGNSLSSCGENLQNLQGVHSCSSLRSWAVTAIYSCATRDSGCSDHCVAVRKR